MAKSFVVSPNAFRLGIGRPTSENAAEHFQGARDPKSLIDSGLTVPFDAGHEQNDEDTFAAREQRHSIYIDRAKPPRKGPCPLKAGSSENWVTKLSKS